MDLPAAHTLPKKERLSAKTDISRLISQGKWGYCPGMRYCVLSPNGEEHHRIMVSVPKKVFKRAVKRNLLKRRIREAYRTQKELLGSDHGCSDILFQYDSREILSSAEVREAVARVLGSVK